MSLFAARLHLPGQTKVPLNVEIDITDERLELTSGGQQFADWPLEELDVVLRQDGFHFKVDTEDVVLNVADSKQFAEALGITDTESAPQHGKGNTIAPLNTSTLHLLSFDDMKLRISRVEEALTSEEVSPPEAFAQWLKLLKEINRRHGQGSIATHHFYELNTQLLDLMPAPGPGAQH
ncbi:MAG: hypothetical protein U9N56_09315 [Actinomycetota bacterium]|nr:hypothetical protein [Actinomycetota bacterium]